MLVEIITLDEFRQAHGKSVHVERASGLPGYLLFEDGAKAHYDPFDRHFTAFEQPPTEAAKSITVRQQYHKIRLERAEIGFLHLWAEQMGSQWIGDGMFVWDEREWGPSPFVEHQRAVLHGVGKDVGKLALLRLQGIVMDHRHALDLLEMQWEALPEVRRQRLHEERERLLDQREAYKQVQRRVRIREITIDDTPANNNHNHQPSPDQGEEE